MQFYIYTASDHTRAVVERDTNRDNSNCIFFVAFSRDNDDEKCMHDTAISVFAQWSSGGWEREKKTLILHFKNRNRM